MGAQGAGRRWHSGPAGSTGNASTLSHLGLSETIVSRLAVENVHTLGDWSELGERRRQLWGITRRVVEQLDTLARELA